MSFECTHVWLPRTLIPHRQVVDYGTSIKTKCFTWQFSKFKSPSFSIFSLYQERMMMDQSPFKIYSFFFFQRATCASNCALSTLRFLLAVEFFEWFQLLNQSLVLIFKQCDAVLQALDVFLLLPSAFTGRFPIGRKEKTIKLNKSRPSSTRI